MPRHRPVRDLRIAALLLLAQLTAGVPAAAAEEPGAAKALPLEVAYASRELPRNQRPALSPDGRWVAYDVELPPLERPEDSEGLEERFLPGGVPSGYERLRLHVAQVEGGSERAVCGEEAACWRGSFSPDSRWLAYYSDAEGSVGLWLYDTTSGTSRQVENVRIKAKLWPGDEAAWSPDGRELFVPVVPATSEASEAEAEPGAAPKAPGPAVEVYHTKGAEGETAPDPTAPMNLHFLRENNAALAAVDVETGAVRIVVPAGASPKPSCLRLSPDGRWLSYLSVFQVADPTTSTVTYDLAVVPVAGGEPQLVAADLQTPEGDYFGATYRWTPDSRRIVFLKDKRLWVSELGESGLGEPHQLAASLGDLQDEPLLLTADGASVLVGQRPEGELTYYFAPARALALVPLAGGAPRVFQISGNPIPAGDSMLWQPDTASFYAVVDEKGSARRSIVEVTIESGSARTVWTDQGRLDFIGALPSGRGVVARFEGLETPPDVYAFDRELKARRISHVEPRLDAVEVGAMEAFESVIPGHDGTLKAVETNIFLPPGAKRGDRLPGLVYFYAGLPFSIYAQDYGGGAPNSIPVQVFATRGYAVLFCDVPLGPQGKGGNPMQEMADAILAQVYRAAELGYIDIRRVGIMGQSYGGYGTAAVITQTNLFRAAMALDGTYDLAGEYARMDPTGGSFNFVWSETGQGRMGTHPWADFKRYVDNSPYYQADKIHTPLLLIHGEKDSACPVEQAQKMFNAMKRLDRECELAIYPGEGHVPGEWALPNAVDATQRMLDFLATHLATRSEDRPREP